MKGNQLFRRKPTIKLIQKLVKCFGFKNINDKKNISKKDFNRFKVISKINNIVPELRKYYIPCKAKIYLKKINNNTVMTILRQYLRIYKYCVISKEKYYKGEKFIIYSLKPLNSIDYKVVGTNKNIKKCKYITINFD